METTNCFSSETDRNTAQIIAIISDMIKSKTNEIREEDTLNEVLFYISEEIYRQFSEDEEYEPNRDVSHDEMVERFINEKILSDDARLLSQIIDEIL